MKFYKSLPFLLFLPFFSLAQNDLLTNFQDPPNAARPRVWWHWMNGNVTKNGIQKDLEWMERTGIGGFQNFDANLFTPQVTEKKLVFMTPEWKDAFRFATELADKKGLEMAIAGSPGWSVTGGPWVPAEDGMKKYVWTETRLAGGQPFSGKLPQPAATTGKFGNHGLPTTSTFGEPIPLAPEHYHDAFVVAYKLLPTDLPLATLNPKISASGGIFSLHELTDNNLNKTSFLPPLAVGEDMWVQYEFAAPQTFKAFSVAGANHTMMEDFDGGPLNRSLKVSNDGVNFREVATVTGSINPLNTIAFPATTAKYWRLCYKTLQPPANLFAAMFGGGTEPPKPEGVQVAEFVLHPTDRIDQAEDKAGFTPWRESYPSFLGENADAIPLENVIDLTQKMKPDGSLDWTPPYPHHGERDNWVILRFGYSLTGRQNHPASPEATGLEVDKLDPDAVRKYINAYLDMYKDATGGLMGNKGLSHMILDSYEAGHMTWTKAMPEEFAKRRGYQIQPWVPVLTGRIVKSREASEAFLWDFRKTIGEMIAENHYDIIGEELHKRGMKRYTESHEDRRIYLADGMDVKRNADIPMSAMWTPGSLAGGSDEEVRSEADIRESASVAHICGKPIVAAESMTSVGNAFTWHPEKLKRTADLEMASGLNRFVIHTSVHQPLDDKMPGFSLGPFGQYFGRQETWSGAGAKAWVDYLSRSCHLLQQGHHVADALVYYGENTNLTWRFKEKLPEIPGYEYDFVNSSALMNVLKVENGKITTPGGGSYSVLVLDESAKLMTLPVLKKLRDLVKAGTKVTGFKPQKSPSLSDDPIEFQTVLNELWGHANVSNQTASNVLKSQGVNEDVIIKNNKAKVLYVHRKTADRDIYWLNSRSAEANSAEVSFRVSGKVPELWSAQTGKTSKLAWRIENGRTIVPLEFEPWDAVFIIFKEKTSETSAVLPKANEKEISKMNGTWQVDFQEKRGAPKTALFEKLYSWSEHEFPGIKYFSGTATYRNAFNIKELKTGSRYFLDLGDVKNIAEVSINGKPVGTVWKTPFKLDITDAVKKGTNHLEIKVANLWVNRLIGDAQPGVKEKITFTTMPFYRGQELLLPSGLLGPVRVVESIIR
jgi:alpha-L-rhamnosidase